MVCVWPCGRLGRSGEWEEGEAVREGSCVPVSEKVRNLGSFGLDFGLPIWESKLTHQKPNG